MRRVLTTSAIVMLAACASAQTPYSGTIPPGYDPARLDKRQCLIVTTLVSEGPARDAAYSEMATVERGEVLLGLPGCFDVADPAFRDGYAFEMLSLILRAGDQPEHTVRTLRTMLLNDLASTDEDTNGFRGPFAVLALSEVARVDRITPFLSEEERWDTLMAAKDYLAGLSDHRGFTEGEGWRHGVAHTADLLMQMSLNGHLTKPQAEEILAAIASKVAPDNHAYIFGESERLAAPVIYLAWKETFTAEEWEAWFTSLWPADDPLRENAYKSEAALMKLHNLRAFAQSAYVGAVASNDDRMNPLAGAAFQFLSQLP